MSQRTVRYIQFPKLKSFLTSCRTAKARCETLIFKTKPRRRNEDRKFQHGSTLAPQKETQEKPVGAEQPASDTK